jgi:hypothetical protein
MRARRTAPFMVLGSALLSIALTGTIALAKPPADKKNPPGNNGTIKIDGVEFDDHPNNEPHPGCIFEIDLYGYDEGEDLNAEVVFEGHPPTGGGVLDVEPKTLFIGEDAAGGGTDLDASQQYDLSDALAGVTPHPKQGYHVKLTVHADGSIGADKKHKVFWVEECEPAGGGGGGGGNNPPPPPPGGGGGGGGGNNPPPPPPGGGGGGGDTGGGGGGGGFIADAAPPVAIEEDNPGLTG